MIESLIGFAAVLLLVLLRMPIAFAMAIVGMAGMTYETNFMAAISLVSRLIIDTRTRERIAAMIGHGASFAVSDNGLGTETGLGTDFIVQVH